MTKLALALVVVLTVGTAHAAGLVQIGQDPNGHPVVGGPGGTPGVKPKTAFNTPNVDQQPDVPPQQTKPLVPPAGASQPAP